MKDYVVKDRDFKLAPLSMDELTLILNRLETIMFRVDELAEKAKADKNVDDASQQEMHMLYVETNFYETILKKNLSEELRALFTDMTEAEIKYKFETETLPGASLGKKTFH